MTLPMGSFTSKRLSEKNYPLEKGVKTYDDKNFSRYVMAYDGNQTHFVSSYTSTYTITTYERSYMYIMISGKLPKTHFITSFTRKVLSK